MKGKWRHSQVEKTPGEFIAILQESSSHTARNLRFGDSGMLIDIKSGSQGKKQLEDLGKPK
jgi:hypothetical protein